MNTIVATATALAKSAISIIRLSGTESLHIAYKLLTCSNTHHTHDNTDKKSVQTPRNNRPLLPRKATLRNIYNPKGDMLDKAIVIYFQAPHSFSGEDIIEIQSHGGTMVANEILRACLEYGAMLAKPGEFSMRALRHNKLDLVELESTLALMNATNANLLPLLSRNLDGKLSALLESVCTEILSIIAHIEVNIDYSDEDIDQNVLESALVTLTHSTQRFQAILDSSRHYHKLQDIKLCIIGKPNVGKSSLLNLLLMQDRAIVSERAGTTRDTIHAMLDICGNLVTLIDTAGMRESTDSIEMQGIERSILAAQKSDIVLCVFDISSEMQKEDTEILNFLACDEMKEKHTIIVLNKNDLERKNSYDFSSFETIALNTKDYRHANLLKEKIANFLTMDFDSNTLILTNTMQATLLESACKNLHSAITLLKNGALELASYELTQSLHTLGQITKPYNVEDMLSAMFSQFCVGK